MPSERPRALRLAVAWLVVFLATTTVTALVPAAAFAHGSSSPLNDPAEEALATAGAVAATDAAAAAAALRSLIGDAAAARVGGTAEQRVRGARVAFDALPFDMGNGVASDLILDVLRENRSQPDAWTLAFRLRDRVMDGLDLAHGEPFLRAMIAVYPEQIRFRYYLMDLFLDSGRPAAADAQCEEILRQVPSDTRAHYVQALLRELDGRIDDAVRLYDEVIALGSDLRAHVIKVRLLWDVQRDYDAAERALTAGFAAVAAAPVGREREEVRADLEVEEELLRGEREQRRLLLAADARLRKLIAGILAGWLIVLGGGVLWLRRQRLV